MPDPIVLVRVNAAGKVTGVGVYPDIEAARHKAFSERGCGSTFSVWTPRMGDWIDAPAVIGLSQP